MRWETLVLLCYFLAALAVSCHNFLAEMAVTRDPQKRSTTRIAFVISAMTFGLLIGATLRLNQ